MGIITRYYQLQRYKKDYYVPNKNELKKLKSLLTIKKQKKISFVLFCLRFTVTLQSKFEFKLFYVIMAKKALLMILDGWGIGKHDKGDVIFKTNV